VRNHILIPILILALAGCGSRATVSESQCYAGDWQTLGYRDGAQGLRNSQLLEHQDACGPFGVVPDRAAYMAGWESGAREYCHPNNAFEVGELGYGHSHICPADMQSDFVAAYRQGRQLYLARRDIAALESTIAAREARLEWVKSRIVAASTEQLNPELTVPQRVDLLAETQRLAEEKAAIEHELPELHADLASRTAQLDSMRQSLVSVVY